MTPSKEFGQYEDIPVMLNEPSSFPKITRKEETMTQEVPPLPRREFKEEIPPLPKGLQSREAYQEEIGRHWATSKTIWGAAINFFVLIFPIIMKNNFGIIVPDYMTPIIGEILTNIVQGTIGLIGTWLIIWGRMDANNKGPLTRREFIIKL